MKAPPVGAPTLAQTGRVAAVVLKTAPVEKKPRAPDLPVRLKAEGSGMQKPRPPELPYGLAADEPSAKRKKAGPPSLTSNWDGSMSVLPAEGPPQRKKASPPSLTSNWDGSITELSAARPSSSTDLQGGHLAPDLSESDFAVLRNLGASLRTRPSFDIMTVSTTAMEAILEFMKIEANRSGSSRQGTAAIMDRLEEAREAAVQPASQTVIEQDTEAEERPPEFGGEREPEDLEAIRQRTNIQKHEDALDASFERLGVCLMEAQACNFENVELSESEDEHGGFGPRAVIKKLAEHRDSRPGPSSAPPVDDDVKMEPAEEESPPPAEEEERPSEYPDWPLVPGERPMDLESTRTPVALNVAEWGLMAALVQEPKLAIGVLTALNGRITRADLVENLQLDRNLTGGLAAFLCVMPSEK